MNRYVNLVLWPMDMTQIYISLFRITEYELLNNLICSEQTAHILLNNLI